MGFGDILGGIYGGIQAGKANKEAKKAEEAAKAENDRMKEIYSNIDTSNPFEGMTNQYAGLENKMEDLTINQKEAEFASQQFAQSQSNIMSGLRGAAGGSGIAALAQSLAQQGQLAAQKSAAEIGKQEAANQASAAEEASKIQDAEIKGAGKARDLQYQKTANQLAAASGEYAAAGTARDQAAKDQTSALGGIATALIPGI